MATYGKIGEFKESEESWTQYIEWLEQYFLANEVEDAGKQRAILLSVCGSKTYALARDLLQPAKPAETTFKKIVDTHEKHFSPKPSEIVERYKFHSRNIAPIVPVVKQDGSVRICGDYKCTVNQVSKLDNYPIPKTEDLLATLGGGNKFTKLDMSQAYQQLLLDEESKKFTTINTHKGLYQYNRLPLGVSSAPGIFQRTMENLLQGIPHVVVRVDDILVSGKDDPDHLANLEAVLSRLSTAGLKLRLAKCLFMQPEVTYCGYVISGDGIQPVAAKLMQSRMHRSQRMSVSYERSWACLTTIIDSYPTSQPSWSPYTSS